MMSELFLNQETPVNVDLLGDFAGSQLFLVEFDALVGQILLDPLINLEDVAYPDFQSLLIVWLLERFLLQLHRRHANFCLVEFLDRKTSMTNRKGSRFEIAARRLARSLLHGHLRTHLKTPFYSFENADSPSWLRFLAHKRPAHIMTTDGSTLPEVLWPALNQHVETLLSQLPIAALELAEYKDSKILAFLYRRKSLEVADTVGDDESAADVEEQRILPSELVPSDGVLTEALSSICSTLECSSSNLIALAVLLDAHASATTPLAVRCQPSVPLNAELNSELTELFLPALFDNLTSALETNEALVTPLDINVRVMRKLLHSLCIGELQDLPEQVLTKCHSVHLNVSSCLKAALKVSTPTLPKRHQAVQPIDQLLPFDNPIIADKMTAIAFDDLLQAQSRTAAPSFAPGIDFPTLFTDETHWHSSEKIVKRPGQMKKLTPWEKKRADRSMQRFMSAMQQQAASLTGANGAVLEQQVVLSAAVSQTANNTLSAERAQKKPANRSGKPPVLSKKDQIRAQALVDSQKKSSDKSLAWWKDQVKSRSSLSAEGQLQGLSDLSRALNVKESQFVATELQLYTINVKIRQFAADGSRIRYRDDFMSDILTLCLGAVSKAVTRYQSKYLRKILTKMGFLDIAADLKIRHSHITDEQELTFKTIGTPEDLCLSGETPIEFQLRRQGPSMERDLDSSKDNRVRFEPDGWQVKVLDAIDHRHSMLVTAPTSAGKTFIAFYAIQKILQSSDTACFCYVAPTKALVNQVTAEVYARFSKTLQSGTLWSLHTRDYRIHDPQKCQILITTPEMLGIMLMSPSLCAKWLPRLQYVVLDEIHSIGIEDSGNVYQELILLLPCPIIALSATVGSPESFAVWLADVAKTQRHGFTFIRHVHRYNALRKYVYAASDNLPAFKSLDQSVDLTALSQIHPAAAVSLNAELPEDLAFEAADCLVLGKLLAEHAPELFPTSLRVENYFKDVCIVKMSHVLDYEKALKELLVVWLSTPPNSQSHEAVKQTLSQLRLATKPAWQWVHSRLSDGPKANHLMHILHELHQRSMLPAIFFAFDRTRVEEAATMVLDSLKDAEASYKKGSLAWQKKLEDYKKWQSQARAREAAAEKAARNSKKDDSSEQPSINSSRWDSFDPDAPLQQFSFLNIRKTSYSALQDQIADYGYLRDRIPAVLFELLGRGIAVHHAGLNRVYRMLVETLFRQGSLRVIFATGTLAMGLNMPAKTSVFYGDSVFLTALQYRQCAGRAGRRGFDTLGHVVFFGLPRDRVFSLLNSRLPQLTGAFPLNATLVLRLMNLLEGSGSDKTAEDMLTRFLSMPRLSADDVTEHDEVLHFFRFSIEYLRRLRLLDSQGRPMNLAGVAIRVYYQAPGNLLLCNVLQSGQLHLFIEQLGETPEYTSLALCSVLAHFFNRRHLPGTVQRTDEAVKRSSSKVFLDALPPNIQAVVQRHETEVLQLFRTYAVTYAQAKKQVLPVETCLPLSEIEVIQASEKPSAIEKVLLPSAETFSARSAFAALSGKADNFESIKDIATTARPGIHLNYHAIPSLNIYTTDGKTAALNAYLVDFLRHGNATALFSIRTNDVWFILQDFDLALASIKQALEELLVKSSQAATQNASEEEEEIAQIQDADEEGASDELIARPPKVLERDWQLYQALATLRADFRKKYRAIFA